MKQKSAPDIEHHAFYENTIDFHFFVTGFQDTVEKRICNLRERLTRLLE